MLKHDHPALTLLLGALVAISPLAMDIYLPSMPAMTTALSATATEVQLTLSVYMFGWGFAQLFAGPVSDRVGRRPSIMWGLVVFIVATVVCALSRDVWMLIAARFVQAASMATVAVVPRAVVRDLHAGDRAAHLLSTMMLVLGVAPVLGPIIGAELHLYFGWQASFVFVAIYAALALIAVKFALPETLVKPDIDALKPRRMLGNWTHALASREFIGYLLTCAFTACGLFAFLAGSAFVFVDVLESGERGYAIYFGTVMIGNFAGSLLARRVVIRVGLARLVAWGTLLQLVAGCTMALLAWLDVRHAFAIVGPMFAFMVGFMWTLPQATAGAMTPFPHMAGSVSSLLSFVQFALAAGAALLVGVTFDGTSRPMASVIAISGVLSFAAFRLFVRSGDRIHRG